MTTEHEMVRVGSTGLAVFEPQSFGELERLARMCASSKLFAITSPEAAIVVMLTGASLGLSPVAAMRGIHVVQGRAVLSSDLIVAVVMRSGQCDRWTVVENSSVRCIIETHRKGSAAPVRHQWAIEDAKRAKLTTKSIWEQFPAAMLRARCSAELGRIVYADVLFGVYVEGEIEGDAERVDVRREGDPRNTPEPDDAAEAAPIPALDGVADLAGVARWYAELALGADDSARAGEASGIAADHLGGMGYLLTAVEHMRALSGQLSGVLRHVHDVLAAEGSPDGVARAYGSLRRLVDDCDDADLRGDCKRTAARYFGQRSVPALTGKAAEKALAAALAPKPPPPTGTDDPAASPLGDAVAAANAQRAPVEASAAPTMRLELDVDEAEARLLRADAVGDAAWRAHLAQHAGDQWAIAIGHAKRRVAFAAAGVVEARRRATVEALTGCASIADEGHADVFLMGREHPRAKAPGMGEVIALKGRTTRERNAARTGTDG